MSEIGGKLLCRACLKEPDDFCSIFDIRLIGEEQLLISEMIYSCTNVEINETDSMTRYICNDCAVLLVQFYTFRKQCQDSDVYLRMKEERHEEIENDFPGEFQSKGSRTVVPCNNEQDEDPIKDQIETHSSKKSATWINVDYNNEELNYSMPDEDVTDDPIKQTDTPPENIVKIRRRSRRKVNYMCEICDLKFENADKRRYHMAKHNESYDYLCNICGEKFKIKRAYTDHMNRHQPNFRCDLCEKAFPNNFQLKLHLRTHTGEKPHVCEVCGLAYKQNSDLKIHMRRHTGEKPIKCRFCEITFISASYRAKHEIYHQDPSIRPFRCNICYKDFRLKKYYRQHVKTHNKNET